uniref:Uncharacterized protein n=1 Tax=Arundo donax TaxID=35708 RepID=A0A0A9GXY4_ARUDO
MRAADPIGQYLLLLSDSPTCLVPDGHGLLEP